LRRASSVVWGKLFCVGISDDEFLGGENIVASGREGVFTSQD